MLTHELIKILNGYFHWNKARMHCFAQMLIGLISTRTVNLAEIACSFTGHAKVLSHYQRMQRFFRHFTLDLNQLAYFVMQVFGLVNQPVYLSLDRTNWQWGQANINILMLSVVYKGIALPLCWQLLPKRGNSNTQERVALLERFITLFGKDCIAGLLADREFIGKEWLSWLHQQHIPFCIRLRANLQVTMGKRPRFPVHALFRSLKVLESQPLKTPYYLDQQPIYLAALRLARGELLVVATDKLMAEPIQCYGKRWQVETLFACLKSKGFRFEQTHMTHPERISKLLALLTVAFCWAHKIGEWQHAQQPIVIKKHQRPWYSLFRYGLDYLRSTLLKGLLTHKPITKAILAPLNIIQSIGV